MTRKPTSRDLQFAAEVCQTIADWMREHEPQATSTIADLESAAFALMLEAEEAVD